MWLACVSRQIVYIAYIGYVCLLVLCFCLLPLILLTCFISLCVWLHSFCVFCVLGQFLLPACVVCSLFLFHFLLCSFVWACLSHADLFILLLYLCQSGGQAQVGNPSVSIPGALDVWGSAFHDVWAALLPVAF